MNKKTILKFILLGVLLLGNFIMLSHFRANKRRNETLESDFLEMQKITGLFQVQKMSPKQSMEIIKDVLRGLNASELLRRLETKDDRVHIQLNGVSQEQLFGFLKNLSKKVKHQIVQCDISLNSPGTLTLIIEIQIL